MNRRIGLSLFVAILAAGCGGSSDSEFVGVADVTPDASGGVAGVSGQSLTIVESEIGSFGHGVIEDIDATLIGDAAGAASGDIGHFAVSGIVDGYDVGGAYISGTATYSGDYALTVVSGLRDSNDPSTWQEETLTGTVTAQIELHTAIAGANDPDHGHSHDVDVVELFIGEEGDPLYFKEVIIYSPTPPARPSTDLHSFDGGFATVGDGDAVPLNGQIAFGSDGLIASFQGQDQDHLVAGGLGLVSGDTSALVSQ